MMLKHKEAGGRGFSERVVRKGILRGHNQLKSECPGCHHAKMWEKNFSEKGECRYKSSRAGVTSVHLKIRNKATWHDLRNQGEERRKETLAGRQSEDCVGKALDGFHETHNMT